MASAVDALLYVMSIEEMFEEKLKFMDERRRCLEEAKARERSRFERLRRWEELRTVGLAIAPWALIASTFFGSKLIS